MKKIIKYLSVSVLSALLLAIIFYQTSFAETVSATSIEQQVGRLATALEGLLVQSKQPAMSQTMWANWGVKNPTCLDNYGTWKKSNVYTNKAKWNVDFIPHTGVTSNTSTQPSKDSFVELNGDGLPDYIYTERTNTPYNSTKYGGSCVYLNNGSGFDLAYKCYAGTSSDYYGDCAG